MPLEADSARAVRSHEMLLGLNVPAIDQSRLNGGSFTYEHATCSYTSVSVLEDTLISLQPHAIHRI